ncbi:hypothetical protein ZWY2020_012320 [Hordeum vulgare]|nr:hypothetical protein ZWY2020_012320 [Hordeum vulgare]
MKARQFINVVMQRYRGDSGYTWSRIKAGEQLFYGSTEEARAAAKSRVNMDWPSSAMVPPWMDTVSRIPPPRLRLQRSVSAKEITDFLPFHERSSGAASKVLCVDAEGHTVLCDVDAGTLADSSDEGRNNFKPAVGSTIALALSSPKGSRPIGFSTINAEAQDRERADVFYVMGRFPISCNPCNFEALMYSDPSNGGRLKGWHWHPLPSPPPAYVDNFPVIRHALLDMH